MERRKIFEKCLHHVGSYRNRMLSLFQTREGEFAGHDTFILGERVHGLP